MIWNSDTFIITRIFFCTGVTGSFGVCLCGMFKTRPEGPEKTIIENSQKRKWFFLSFISGGGERNKILTTLQYNHLVTSLFIHFKLWPFNGTGRGSLVVRTLTSQPEVRVRNLLNMTLKWRSRVTLSANTIKNTHFYGVECQAYVNICGTPPTDGNVSARVNNSRMRCKSNIKFPIILLWKRGSVLVSTFTCSAIPIMGESYLFSHKSKRIRNQ